MSEIAKLILIGIVLVVLALMYGGGSRHDIARARAACAGTPAAEMDGCLRIEMGMDNNG